jgi:hypothetical protein
MKYWMQLIFILLLIPVGFSQQERFQKKTFAENKVSEKSTKKPIFGVVEIQKKTVYVGENVLVNGKIFTKYDLAVESYSSYELNGNPEIKQLPAPSVPDFTPISINGQAYFSTTFDNKILFFSSPGKYKFGPFKMGVVYETPDDFINLKLISSQETIEVIPLPQNAPKNFIGGIGEFSFTRKFDFLDVKQGDVVEMTIEIEGKGNVQNSTKPDFELPEGVILYGDPGVTELIGYHKSGARGRKTYTYLLQFLEKGKFTIPMMKISYFNLDKKKYITLESNAIEINVEKSNQFENQVYDNSDGLAGLPQITEKKSNSKTSLVLLIVLIAIALGIFLFFFLKRKSNKEPDVIIEIIPENKEIKNIESVISQADFFQKKGDYKRSYQQFEVAIRTMVNYVSENPDEMIKQEALLQKLSQLRVLCETARFLDSYEIEQAKSLQIQLNSIFESIQEKEH